MPYSVSFDIPCEAFYFTAASPNPSAHGSENFQNAGNEVVGRAVYERAARAFQGLRHATLRARRSEYHHSSRLFTSGNRLGSFVMPETVRYGDATRARIAATDPESSWLLPQRLATASGGPLAGPSSAQAAMRPLRIGVLGRIDPVKDLDLILDGAVLLREEMNGRPFELRIYGRFDPENPYHAHLGRRLADEGLADVVRFMGGYGPDDLPRIYGEIDLLGMASISEVSPLVVMEAMMHETPVVATDVGEVGAFLRAREEAPAGIVVARREDRAAMAREWAAAVANLAQDPRMACAMGARGREIAQARFTVDAMVEKHLAVFDAVREASSDARGALSLRVVGHPFSMNGVMMFYERLLGGIKSKRPASSLSMDAFTTRPRPIAREEALRPLDSVQVHVTDASARSGFVSDARIEAEFAPALCTFLVAVKKVNVGDFPAGLQAPAAPFPDGEALQAAARALADMSRFLQTHDAYACIAASRPVRAALSRVFGDLPPEEIEHLRTTLFDDAFLGGPLTASHEGFETFYTPNPLHFVFPGVIAKIERGAKLVIGLHSHEMRLFFQHFDVGPDGGESALPFLNKTRSYSAATRRVLQQYFGLVGHLAFHHADRLVHYSSDTQAWVEAHYGVAPEKSVRIDIGIPDTWDPALSKRAELRAAMPLDGTGNRLAPAAPPATVITTKTTIRPLNVLFVTAPRSAGGARTTLIELATGLKRNGHQVTLLTGTEADPSFYHEWRCATGAEALKDPSLSLRKLADGQRMARRSAPPEMLRAIGVALAQSGADVVHGHTLLNNGEQILDALRAFRRPGVGIVNTSHDASSAHRATLPFDQDIVVSQYVDGVYRLQPNRIPGRPSAVIYPSIDMSVFSPEGPADEEILALPYPRIVVCTRLDQGKGLLIAPGAFAGVRGAHSGDPRYGALIYSHPPSTPASAVKDAAIKQHILARAAEEGIPTVHFLSRSRAEVAAVMRAATLVWNPSVEFFPGSVPHRIFEALGVSAVEARACGALALGTDSGGQEEAVPADLRAYLFARTGDAAHLAALSNRLLDDSRLAERVRREATAYTRATFTLDHTVRATERSYVVAIANSLSTGHVGPVPLQA